MLKNIRNQIQILDGKNFDKDLIQISQMLWLFYNTICGLS